MITKVNYSSIPYDNLFRALCITPYHGHSKGCPNYNIKDGCPPQKLINDVFDFNKELYVVFTEFEIGKFAERMRVKHPEWKEFTFPDHPKKTSEFVKTITDKIHKNHPEWPEEYFPKKMTEPWTSSRQWYNPRIWQSTARKEHKNEVKDFILKNPELIINRCPEAQGVNLTGLMYNIGIELKWQWPPIHDINNKSYIISISGYPNLSNE